MEFPSLALEIKKDLNATNKQEQTCLGNTCVGGGRNLSAFKDENKEAQETEWFIGQNLADPHLMDLTIPHHRRKSWLHGLRVVFHFQLCEPADCKISTLRREIK